MVEPYWRSSASSLVCTQMRHLVPSGVSAIWISLFKVLCAQVVLVF